MDLPQLVQQGWNDHATDAEGVARRLPEGVGLATEPGHAPMLAGLVVHVLGEHLGRWDEGDALLARVLERGLAPDDAPETRAVWRQRAVLRRCAGDAEREAEFARRGRSDAREESDRVRILAIAASAFLGQRRIEEAARDFEEAVRLADYGPDRDDPAARALAVTSNNLSCELETRTDRTPAETDLMLNAARAGRRFWEVAGDWRNVERAEYRLSAAHLAAGDAAGALRHAETCRSICRENGEDPLELFFAEERLALAHHARGDAAEAQTARDASAAHLAAVADPDTRAWLHGELSKLDAALSR